MSPNFNKTLTPGTHHLPMAKHDNEEDLGATPAAQKANDLQGRGGAPEGETGEVEAELGGQHVGDHVHKDGPPHCSQQLRGGEARQCQCVCV